MAISLVWPLMKQKVCGSTELWLRKLVLGKATLWQTKRWVDNIKMVPSHTGYEDLNSTDLSIGLMLKE
jgi:hypothetical protein